MMNLGLRGTFVLTVALSVVLFSPKPAQSGGSFACCYTDGHCATHSSDIACTGSGGISFFADTDCDPNPCPQPGACCDASGCYESLESVCSAGFFEGETCPSTSCCGDGTCAADEDACTCPDDCNDPDACESCECGGLGGNCGCDADCYDRGDCCANACDECSACDPICGNGFCGPDEDSCSCPDDCPDDPDSCSDCECGAQSSGGCWCDLACTLNNDCCSNVCDLCACCGDGICQFEEDHCSCPDCTDPNPTLCDPCECGESSGDETCFCDDICVVAEDCCSNACDECGSCSFCGDGTCSDDEDPCFCPEDCSACGDGVCEESIHCEDCFSCPEDCLFNCGDGLCDFDFDCEDCSNCPDDCECSAPANDACDTAESLNIGDTVSVNNSAAGGDATPICGTVFAENEVWYSVVGNGETLTAHTCNAGTAIDTVIEVFCECGAIDTVACNDDDCDLSSSIAWCSEAGRTYFIAVGAFAGTQSGDIEFSISADASGCSPAACAVPSGACCFDDGSCSVLTESECGDQLGSYQGDDSLCDPNPCPQPTGACVTAGGVCTETTQTECFDSGGTFLAGTSCGACCMSDGSCIETTESDCGGSFLGTYQGDDTLCADVTCPEPTGACCSFSPIGDSCTVGSESACTAGLYAGDGTTCTPTVCNGACCTPIGCTEAPASTCFIFFQGLGTTCDTSCPGGACCTDTGCLEVPSSMQCEFSLFGTYQGDGTDCDPDPCPSACCFPDGSCQELSAADCTSQGGTPGDAGSDCSTNTCPQPPIGACCLTVGGCADSTSQAVCAQVAGTFAGEGTVCADGVCPGTCCLTDGSCIEATSADCTAQGGAPAPLQACEVCPTAFACCFSDGSCETLTFDACAERGGSSDALGDCSTVSCPPPTGACCFPSGECTPETTETDCQSQGGAYQGDESLCGSSVPNCPQPPVGACCLETGSCGNATTQFGCEAKGGVYQGDSTECQTTVCPQPAACCFFGAGGGFSDGGEMVAGAPAGSCTELTPAQCALANGVPQSAGTTCDPNPCVTACCFIDGSCSVIATESCIANGGTPQAPGSTCTPNVCPAPACCMASGACEEVPVGDCFAAGGTAQPPGITCDPDPCPAANECASQPVGTPCGLDDKNACTATCTAPSVCGIDCDDDNACTTDSCDPSTGCVHAPISCEDNDPCTLDRCDEVTGCVNEPFCGACCLREANGNVAGPIATGCIDTFAVTCEKGFGGEFLGAGTSCETSTCNPERADISTKGSLLIFSDVELEWAAGPAAGVVSTLTTDTVISLTNDYPGEVYVQMYFINGDPELDPLFVGNPPTLVREGEPGCNWVDCQLLLTPDQPIYWSAATGSPAGCQPFDILDPDLGGGPGRPNPDAADGSRVLRGYIVAWAVDQFGQEINWNHLSGKATIVDYAAQTAWEYEPWAFQAHENLHGEVLPQPGILELNGIEYDQAFDMLLYDFFAAGSQAFSSDGNTVTLDGELTLHPVTHDLRQEHDEPVTTKAHFDIWNMNERKLSNTRRCLTCWDQALLSTFNAPNSFRLENLQSDKGKARIDGKQADECEENCFRDPMGNPLPIEDLLELLGDLFGEVDVVCSQDAALLGVATKILTFSGPAGQRAVAGSPLVGMGFEPAVIQYDIIDPPGTLREEAFQRIGRTPPREHDRLERGKQEPRG